MKFRSFVDSVKEDVDKFGHAIWALPIFAVVTVFVAWMIAFSLGNSAETRQQEVFDDIAIVSQEACQRENLIRERVNTNVYVVEQLLATAADARFREAQNLELTSEEAEEIESVAFAYLELVDELEYLVLLDCEKEALPDRCEFLD